VQSSWLMTLVMLVMSKRQEGINEEAVYGQLPNQVKGVSSPLLLVQEG